MDTKELLTELFKKFPGIGQKQAERFTYFIARAHPKYIANIQNQIEKVRKNTKECDKCFILHELETKTCNRCLTDSNILIIVEKDVDVYAIENTIKKPIHFFVLGRLFPIIETTVPIRIQNLLKKIEKNPPKEIIIALSIHPDAEHTMRFISSKIQNKFSKIVITTLGRGLSGGSEIEYTDQETINNAFNSRIKI